MDETWRDEVERRLTALEDAAGAGDRSEATTSTALDAARFWALAGLKERLPEGGVLLTGSITLPGRDDVSAEWQQAAPTEAVLADDWATAADALAALGHPVRLQLLQAVLTGTTTTNDLGELDEIGTRGQLHHHLRELLATGWLRSAGRGNYEVPASRMVPLLATILGVSR